MPRQIKRRAVSKVLLGYSQIKQKYGDLFRDYQKENQQKFEQIAVDIARNGGDIRSLSQRIDKLTERLENIIKTQDTFQKQLYSLERSNEPSQNHHVEEAGAKKNSEKLFADNHLLDEFYTRFEDRFKDTAETKKLHKLYEKLFVNNTDIDFSKHPVVDVGCGRGEFLEYMRELKINSLGVDINTDMVKRAKDRGFKVEQGDAIKYLKDADARSLGAVTGFHIVEHIPFEALLELLSAAYSSLAPGGFALFETPNPENILVSTNTFYFDPSHLRPLPPELLLFAFEVTGFKDTEIIRSYPLKNTNETNLDDEIFKRFYGPRNYAVIGYK